MTKKIFILILFILNLNYLYGQQAKHKGAIKKAGKYDIEIVKGDGVLSVYVTSRSNDSVGIKTLKGIVNLKFDQKIETKETFDLSNVTFFTLPMKKAYFKSGVLSIMINGKKYNVKFKRSDIIKSDRNIHEEKIPRTAPNSHQGHTH